jgi:hypothetical protein
VRHACCGAMLLLAQAYAGVSHVLLVSAAAAAAAAVVTVACVEV